MEGVDINMKTKDGQTILHLAVIHGHLKICQGVVGHGGC
jgi:ankyrin repeat protein